MRELFIPDIQQTEDLTGPELVREVNDRLRAMSEAVNANFRETAGIVNLLISDVNLLAFIESIYTTSFRYRNDVTYTIAEVHADVIVETIKFVAESETDVTVLMTINGIPMVSDPPMPITLNLANNYEVEATVLGDNVGEVGDVIEVTTTLGTNNDFLYIASSIYYVDYRLPDAPPYYFG